MSDEPGILEQQCESLADLLDEHRSVGFMLDSAARLLRDAAEEIALLRSYLRAALAELDE